MKETNKKKQHAHKNVIDGRKPFTTPIPKTGENDLHELRVSDYGRYYLFRQVNWCQGDGFFLSLGTRAGAIAMAGTQNWWRRFPPLLGCQFYMVRTC